MNLPSRTKYSFSVILILFLCMVLFPAVFFLPASYYFENSWVENFQALILAAAVVISLLHLKIERNPKAYLFWQGLALLWGFAFLRELSWGRVFYQSGMTETGPVFLPLHMLWYKGLVYLFLTLAIFRALFCFCAARCYVLQKVRRLHLSDVLFVFILLFCSQLVFEKGIIPLLAPYAQQLEETAELIAYLSALAIQFSCIL